MTITKTNKEKKRKSIQVNDNNNGIPVPSSSSSSSNKESIQYYARVFISTRKDVRSKFSRSVGNLIHGSSVTGNTSVVTGIDDIGDGEMTWNYFLLL